MKKRYTTLLAALVMLLVSVLCGTSAEAEPFSMRGGVKFGMTPAEVIAVEESNGFSNMPTRDGDAFKSLSDWQVYYNGNYQFFSDPDAGEVDTVIVERWEYDFDYEDQTLFQCYYLLHPIDPSQDISVTVGAMSRALMDVYGPSDETEERTTKKYKEWSNDEITLYNRWALPDGDGGTVIIDLFTIYDMIFLAYQKV